VYLERDLQDQDVETSEQTLRRMVFQADPKAWAWIKLLERFDYFAAIDRAVGYQDGWARRTASRLDTDRHLLSAQRAIEATLTREADQVGLGLGHSYANRPMPEELLPREYRERQRAQGGYRLPAVDLRALRAPGPPYDNHPTKSHAGDRLRDTDLLNGVESFAKRGHVVVLNSLSRSLPPWASGTQTYRIVNGGVMKQNGHKPGQWHVWRFECFPISSDDQQMWWAARNGGPPIYAATAKRLAEKIRAGK
jgi:hypothetical protein